MMGIHITSKKLTDSFWPNGMAPLNRTIQLGPNVRFCPKVAAHQELTKLSGIVPKRPRTAR